MPRIILPNPKGIAELEIAKKSGRVVNWAPLKNNRVLSEVDLIVPYHGQYDHVGKLIETLWNTTSNIYYNLVLVDDGSPNSDFADKIEGMKVPSVFVVRHSERKGFGAAINSGIRESKSPWVVVLNSDVEFEVGNWLVALGETYQALRDQNVKMVSARYCNAPPGDHRVIGNKGVETSDVVIEADGIGDILDGEAYLPLVCVLAHRELFSRVGMFKEYPLGWYEDLEFACRLHRHGFRQAISGRSWVRHEGGATVNTLCEKEKKTRKIFESNFERCCLDIENLQKSMPLP